MCDLRQVDRIANLFIHSVVEGWIQRGSAPLRHRRTSVVCLVGGVCTDPDPGIAQCTFAGGLLNFKWRDYFEHIADTNTKWRLKIQKAGEYNLCLHKTILWTLHLFVNYENYNGFFPWRGSSQWRGYRRLFVADSFIAFATRQTLTKMERTHSDSACAFCHSTPGMLSPCCVTWGSTWIASKPLTDRYI